MTTYYVYSGASGAANGTSWTDAYTTLGAGITAATAAGDEVWAASDHNEQLAADAVYTIGSAHTHATPLKIFSVNRTTDAYAYGASVGHTSLNRGISFLGAGTAYWLFGFYLQLAGSVTDHIQTCSSARQIAVLEECVVDFITTNTSARLVLGGVTNNPSLTITKKCQFFWGATAQGVLVQGRWESYDDNLSAGATNPTSLIPSSTNNGGGVHIEGSDFSGIVNIATPVSNQNMLLDVEVVNCKMTPGFVMLSSTPTSALTKVIVRDCSDGDQHYVFGYSDYMGTLLIDTGIYANDNIGSTALSWKITTTANTSYAAPFITPWINSEHSGTSAITPYLECLRSGSTTAFTDAEVWAETMAKVTAGSTRSTLYTDRVAPRGTAAGQTASSKGAADWTGEHASSNWFGKLGQSSLTPAEAGFLRMRVCVGAPSETLYVDPQIRT